jgi:tricorn protease
MHRLTKRSLPAVATGLILSAAVASAQTKLLRFPDIHGDEVVFCYGGDLWKAASDGGTAVRLTAHPGQELFPRFSPDGEWIAFTGQYDGDEQVYLIPAAGGVPRQLTYYPARGPLPPRWGYDNLVYGWTPDGSAVLFRSLRDANGGGTESALYTVSVDGGLPVKLPMPTSGAGDFESTGRRMVYSPLFRDFRTWKRYQGGWAQDLYIFDLATHQATLIAPSERSERDPMWIGSTIYFTSDRSGTLNLYAYDVTSGAVEQVTSSSTWDVRWPGSDNTSSIVYELAGELRVLDVGTGEDVGIAITVPDDGLSRRPSRYPAYNNIEDFELSPGGERALFVARGDVFTAPIEDGPTRNLTNSSGAHDKHARWSPDGSKIAFISDMSGEDQVSVIDQSGRGEPEQLTTDFAAMLWPPAWSPDGARLALSDKDGKLHVLTIDSREVVEVADDEFSGIDDYAWSPGGAHLAFSMGDHTGLDSVYIWSAADGQTRRVTGEHFNEYGPAWGAEGNYLFYLSDREFSPQISNLEWNFATNRTTGIFAMALRRDVPNPFPPKSDEVKTVPDRESADAADEDEPGTPRQAIEPIEIDFEGLADRVTRVPVEPGNYEALRTAEGKLVYMSSGPWYYGRRSPERPSLEVFSLEDREAAVLVEDVDGYALSFDGRKALVQQGETYVLHAVRAGKNGWGEGRRSNGGSRKGGRGDDEPKTVSTKGLMVDRVPAEEWAAIFDEVWRRYRDFFYVPNMHGYDWKAIGDRYRPLVEHVAHRSDLNYVLGEMVSELNVGHAYIQGGDFEIPDRPKVGLPGARFVLDAEAGRYRISRILAGDNEEPRYRAPLTEVGVDVEAGEYVLAIDGVELRGSDNPYRLLQHKTDPVSLTVSSAPTLEGSREVTYRPIASEAALLYKEWVDGNRRQVDEATGGRVGYLHLPDMGGPGISEFIKWFYPQIRKQGLIVDVRSNGGGNVSQILLERLDSTLLGTRFGYASDHPRTYPYTVFHGHQVCLINETSASDGDIFPARFRAAGLGPLIGQRTWGGVVGISGRGPLIDGGTVYVPMSGTNDVDGSWIIEGYGVAPDIEVANDPASVIAGRDLQLERGIEEVLRQIEEEPMLLPTRPPDPVKTK